MTMLNVFTLLATASLVSAGYSSYDYDTYSPDGHHNSWSGHHYSSSHGYDTAPLDHDGRVVDTPEVAHAKAKHFAAHAAAKKAAKKSGGDKWGYSHESYTPVTHTSFATPEHHHASWSPAYEEEYVAPKWSASPAHVELTHDGGFLHDTPEVAKAKVDHFLAVAEIEHDAGVARDHHYDSDYDYHYSPTFGSYKSSYHHSSFY